MSICYGKAILVALVGVLGPAWQSSARGQDSEALAEE
jgi:hypothetical protein